MIRYVPELDDSNRSSIPEKMATTNQLLRTLSASTFLSKKIQVARMLVNQSITYEELGIIF